MKRAADIDAVAADWLQRRESPSWTAADEEALAQWAADDRAHHIAMLRLSSVWSKADRLRVTGASIQQDPVGSAEDADVENLRPKRRWQGWLWPTAIAASLAMLGLPFVHNALSGEVYSTPIGGFQQVPLADGSQIEINTDSRVKVDYSEAERHIALAHGEAYFQVAKNASRPFRVETVEWVVTAIGTAFTVNVGKDMVDVIVTEGRIRIDPLGVTPQRHKPVYAQAGQAVRLRTSKDAAPIVQQLDGREIEAALGWRDGLLTFEGQPLPDVAAEMNRYNRLQMVVHPSAAHVTIDGSFRTTNAVGLIRLLEEGFAVRAEMKGDQVLLIEKNAE